MTRLIQLGDLPSDLLAEIAERLRFYTIAFTTVDASGDPKLLGSGVLISAGGVRAILTADHVREVLPTKDRLGLFLTSGTSFESIDVAGVTSLRIARGRSDSAGPDLGAIVLSPTIASSIGARKSFFNLDLHRPSIQQQTPDVTAGTWFAQGFLQEETALERHAGHFDFYLYALTGVGAPDAVTAAGDHDYVDFLVSHDARATMPKSWGGMSGGGLWQVSLLEANDRLTFDRPVLAGILFYQYPTTDDVCGVKGHAWKSIYDVAFDALSTGK